MGRGTTVIEAALAGRTPAGCDINPLSAMLAQPRLSPPTVDDVAAQARGARSVVCDVSYPRELEVFYHPDTLREICALREYLLAREAAGLARRGRPLDPHGRGQPADRTLARVFLGLHAAAEPGRVGRRAGAINARRRQVPPRRDVRALIVAKTRSLLTDCDARHARDAAAIGESRDAADAAGALDAAARRRTR